MSTRLKPCVLACAVLACAAPAARAEPMAGTEFSVADYWHGGAETGDDGQFLYCHATILHGQSQELVFLLRRDDRFIILLGTTATTFTPGTRIESGLAINGGPITPFTADALDVGTLALSFPNIDHSIQSLRESELLSIVASPTLTLTLATPGIGAALDRAKACLDSHTAPD